MTLRLTQFGRAATAATAALALLAVDAGSSVARVETAADPAVTASAGHRTAVLAAGQIDAPIPALQWRACNDGTGLRCARADVPLDYDRPLGETISLKLVKRVATPKSGQPKIGTLFVNPGGPGGPSSGVVSIFARLLGDRVRQRFDVIGIDPRGIGGSAPVRCRIVDAAPPYPRRAFPMTAREVSSRLRFDRYLRKSCRQGGNTILDHMTTADTARDMDLIRQAVGDEKLSYYGVSYGTYLGATYAAMFPDRVRAVIADGVLDPVAWATGRNGAGTREPFSARLGSGYGASEAMTSALEVCDRVGKTRCAFAGDALTKWRRLMNRFRQGPVRLSDGYLLHYADIVSYTLGGLYNRASYRPLMRDLRDLYRMTFDQTTATAAYGPSDSSRLRDRMAERERAVPYASYGPGFSPGFEAVACADTVNPDDPEAWVAAGVRADRRGPWFGRPWTWVSSPCARWPGSDSDAYRGPFRRTTASPVLIVGNAHDPATPVSGAYALHRLFGNSRMFTLNTWGHGAIGESRCVTDRFSAYLISGALPPEGSVCQADRALYPR